MILTLYYMYATILQWWRLGSLRNKLNGTLNTNNALLLSNSKIIHLSKRQRSIENLLFHVEDRIACTVVPKQNVNLSHWVLFPRNQKLFPIYFSTAKCSLKPPFLYITVKAVLETYTKHDSEVLQMEKFGEPIAWKAASKFEVVLKTDLDNLTKIVQYFSNSAIDINHDLEILEIETVNIEGAPNKIKYERKYSVGEILKYSHSPVYWKKFSKELKELYLKIREHSNPKIKIENGASRVEEVKIVPVYEVKPMKKESKKIIDDKYTLEVGGSDHRRSKTGDKKDKIHDDKQRTEKKIREESPKARESKIDKKLKGKHVSVKSELTIKSKQKTQENVIPSNENVAEKSVDISNPEKKPSNSENIPESVSQTKDESDESRTIKAKSENKSKVEKHECSNDQKVIDNINNQSKGKLELGGETEIKEASTSKMKNGEIDQNIKGKTKRSQLREVREKKPTSKDVVATNSNIQSSVTEFLSCSKYASSNVDNKRGCSDISNDTLSKLESNVKPPNILVYADSVIAKDNVKAVLNSVINSEKYIVYDLPTNISTNPVWSESTALVVICGATTPDLTAQLLQYLVSGGQLLCLCSDLLHSILSVFSTAEVREHELVRFSYGEWRRVKMMHHIFCYQASPAKKQFSKDSVESNHSNGSSPIAPRTPSTAEIQHNGKSYILQVQVLGTEETWQTPSLLLANVKNSKGRAIFSQVHLEIDPLQYEDDESKFIALKDSNQARIEILTDILKNRLDIDCSEISNPIYYTPAYFLGRHDMKTELFKECKEIVDETLECDKMTVVFCGKNVDPGVASATRLPVMLYSCPSSFSTVEYFSTLNTDMIGRLVIYADVLESSQYLLSKTLKHGLVVIPRQQSASIGRSNNVWLSPVGSACFSLQLHIPLSSPLGRMLSLVQQLVTVAIIEAIKKDDAYNKLDIGIKWPNDIYLNGTIKIGGLLVSSSVGNKMAVLNIGCGLNLDNPEPTISLNDYIAQYNKHNKTDLLKFSHEKYFAMVFNEIENLYDIVQNDNLDYLYDLYYKHWIHQNTKIKIRTEEGHMKNATIIGIDDFGFLKVRLETGEISVVQPDGNTFDMIKGLIVPKASY